VVENKIWEKYSTQTPTAWGPQSFGKTEEEWTPIKGLQAVGEEKILVL
jgi:hypothetical protein